MAESTLSLTFEDLADAVSKYLGWGRDYTACSATQQDEIGDHVEAGQREFYGAHKWTFLRPRAALALWPEVSGTMAANPTYNAGTGLSTCVLVAPTTNLAATMIGRTITFVDTTVVALTNYSYVIAAVDSTVQLKVVGDLDGLIAGAYTWGIPAGDYRLPDDFGSLDGGLYFHPDHGRQQKIQMTGWAEIDRLRGKGEVTRAPQYGTIMASSSDLSGGQRFDLLVWPWPDQEYDLYYRYRVHPAKLVASTANYPYGGMAHGETLKAACIAHAELHINNVHMGPHKAEYGRLLAASIQRDHELGVEYRGYNADHSDGADRLNVPWHWSSNVRCTFEDET